MPQWWERTRLIAFNVFIRVGSYFSDACTLNCVTGSLACSSHDHIVDNAYCHVSHCSGFGSSLLFCVAENWFAPGTWHSQYSFSFLLDPCSEPRRNTTAFDAACKRTREVGHLVASGLTSLSSLNSQSCCWAGFLAWNGSFAAFLYLETLTSFSTECPTSAV